MSSFRLLLINRCTEILELLVVHVNGVRLSLWTAASNGPIVHPQGRCIESYDGMILTGENWRTRREPVPMSLCLPQIPHGMTRARTWASVVRGRRLTAWTMARPWNCLLQCFSKFFACGIVFQAEKFPVTPPLTIIYIWIECPAMMRTFLYKIFSFKI
jgi:hypothetical protein